MRYFETLDGKMNQLAGTTPMILDCVAKIDHDYDKIQTKLSESSELFGKDGASKRILDVTFAFFKRKGYSQ